MLKKDYIIRQIEMLANFISKIVFNKSNSTFNLLPENTKENLELNSLYLNLRELVDNGKINDAEDLLFNNIELNPNFGFLEIAVDFYSYLNKLDDEFLIKNNFSKDEVLEGIKDIEKIYRVESMLP